MTAAPDYKAMYLELFRANEQAARLLWAAQQRAEEKLLEADEASFIRLADCRGPQGPDASGAEGDLLLPDRSAKGSPDRGAGNADRH